MILIADSGSTKTNWHLSGKGQKGSASCQTAGINPYYQTKEEIVKTLSEASLLRREGIRHIFFYGAGCANPEKNAVLEGALRAYFHVEAIDVASDLLAAARSLCGHSEGVAAILGTGSNSCYYDGQGIRQHVPPLGYILGDEGSGAVLGRKLAADLLKNQMPEYLQARFLEMFGQSAIDIMEQVYRKPFPNRYLASFTPFLSRYIKEEPVYLLVKHSFIAFFRRNIQQYPRARDLPVHFTGSIAWHFSDLLKEAATECGFTLGDIIQDPMQGLIEFHRNFKRNK
ncbi:MAG: ATPase [Bacteroides sp.]|jgi:N-acetylglucosamine kinase-like BadF-type ATPase|nr:ATPase [Bacteroides sp.]